MKALDPARFEHLKSLEPIEAIRAWLRMSFGIGDEPAMIHAIKKDPRIDLTGQEICDAMCDALDDDLTPEETLQLLLTYQPSDEPDDEDDDGPDLTGFPPR